VLVALALALAAGIASADLGLLGVVAAQCLVVQGLVLGTCSRGRPRARLACALLASFGAGALALAERREAAHWPAGAGALEATVEGRVAERGRSGASLSVVLEGVRRSDGAAEPVPPRLRLRLEGDERSALARSVPGDRVRARVRLRPLVSRFDPGTPDPAERLRRAGIGATGRLVHPALAVRYERGALLRVRAAFDARRTQAAERLARSGAGLAAALAFGERSGLAPAHEERLRAAGLAHLLAVSGLNLTMVAALAFGAGRRLLLALAPCATSDPRRAALAIAWAAALVYAGLSGFVVSVQRAFAFLSVVVVALSLRRGPRPGPLLAAAALAVLVVEPAALFDPGAQLSFAAAAALLLARAAPEAGAAAPALRARRALGLALRAAATAAAATSPLAAWHFGRVAPATLAANLVAVPFTELVLLPASLAAALAALAAPESGWLGVVPEQVVVAGGRVLLACAELATRGPGAERLASPAPLALAAAAGAGAAALAARRTPTRVLWACAVQALLAFAPPARLLPDPPRLVALDVGQGDAIVVQGARGAILVDGGIARAGEVDLGRSVVLPALAALGVARLDLVVATHADLDHRGGLPAVVERVPTARVWIPAGTASDPAFGELVAASRRRGAALEERGLGDPPLVAGELRVVPLWPPRAPTAGARDNDRSLVLRVESGSVRVLLAGDVEAAAEAALVAGDDALAADVLKLAHHGSRTSSSAAFLERVGAVAAIASAPCLGRFGMPHAEVRARVAGAGASLWWTGRDGAVAVGLARPLAVRGFAPLRPRRERWRCDAG
jgi:competence protein ComEC